MGSRLRVQALTQKNTHVRLWMPPFSSPLMGEGYEGLAALPPSRSWMGVMFGEWLYAEHHPHPAPT